MKKADISPDSAKIGSAAYPSPYDEAVAGRKTWMLTKQYGLNQFGVNRVELPPNTWSTQRHWHTKNDEAVIMVSGELVLVTDDGEETLKAGDCVCFKAGESNAHHLQNRSDQPAVYYDIGGRDTWDKSYFPDIGLEARTLMQINFRDIKEK